MKVDLGIWDKLTRLVIFLLFVAGVLGLAVWYLPLIKQNERMRREILRATRSGIRSSRFTGQPASCRSPRIDIAPIAL